MLFHAFINSQIWLCKKFDLLLPEEMKIDGNRYFVDHFAPEALKPGQTIVDVGGGKNPFVNMSRKKELNLRIIGLDIDPHELAQAPFEIYDRTICEDICVCSEKADADLVISQALMEHVPDAESALKGIHTLLREGGSAVIFLPSKYAVFALINKILPEGIKKFRG
jgi:2-polyprenyl-6-hydroxyphenyl methylase/3-demethylubiquinone-9 3-methyltransferase